MNAVPHELPLRVVKLGGSLLGLPDWIERFGAWRAATHPACDIVVVGGGKQVDKLRATQGASNQSDESAHWQAIDIMSDNAEIVAKALNGAVWTDDIQMIQSATAPRLTVFDPAKFLRADAGPGALPANWDVTSDSIAARVACRCDASELVLIKSASPAPGRSQVGLGESSYLDRHFAQAAKDVPAVRCVNLRAAHAPSVELPPSITRLGAWVQERARG